MKLRLNISPCPNDTFMFDALVNGRIDTGDFRFEVEYHDIEQLNLGAKKGDSDITKISYAVLPQLARDYFLCDSGSALGRGNGPLLVSRAEVTDRIREAVMSEGGGDLKIAVPGYHTTANLLMQRLFPTIVDISEVLFSEIAHRVSARDFDAGILIHEGRFTYREKGLGLICDLGTEWESQTGLPLPLGGIAVSRKLPENLAREFERLLRQSIRFALDNPDISRPYVKSHAREMNDAVIDSHISLFVNDYSLSLGDTGIRAIGELTGLDPAAFL